MMASTSAGKILRASTQWNPYTNGFRGAIDVQLEPGETADVRGFLRGGIKTLTETWIYPFEVAPNPAPQPAPIAQDPPASATTAQGPSRDMPVKDASGKDGAPKEGAPKDGAPKEPPSKGPSAK